jgi:hypothetical protein
MKKAELLAEVQRLALPPAKVDPAVPIVVKSPDAYRFIQLGWPIAVTGTRGEEEYSDVRMTVGINVCSHGEPVSSITLAGSWFDVVAGSRAYRVPMTNVRSARRS